MQKSVAVRNAQLDALETAIGVSPIMQLRSGTMPATCATARTGTVIATLNLPSDWLAAASSGSKAKAGTWEDTAADAGGYAGYFSVQDSTGTTCHLQGLVAQNWAASTPFAVGQQVNNDTGKCYRCTTAGTSAGSGGPTGTGATITDGTAVWQYIGLTDLVVDNTSFGVGQAFTVSAFTLSSDGA